MKTVDERLHYAAKVMVEAATLIEAQIVKSRPMDETAVETLRIVAALLRTSAARIKGEPSVVQ